MKTNEIIVYTEMTEKAKSRIVRFINKKFMFDETEKMNGVFKYNYTAEKFEVSLSLRPKNIKADSKEMKLLRHDFGMDDAQDVSIDININNNVLSGNICFANADSHIVKYEINRLRLKCNHVNTFPFSNGDPICMEYIENAIEEFISSVKQNNDNANLQFVYFEGDHILISTPTDNIKKGLHSEEYLKYKVIIEEINPEPHSSITLMFFPDKSISAYSVVVEVTEYDETGKAINKENETFLVDMK